MTDTTRSTVYLSARGWGDYSPVQWTGDLSRPDVEIISECQALLAAGHDVDRPHQTDEEIADEIAAARESLRTAPARAAEIHEHEAKRRRDGYCDRCGSYCYGDCTASQED